MKIYVPFFARREMWKCEAIIHIFVDFSDFIGAQA